MIFLIIAAPSGPPQSISGSVISSTSVQLSWSPPLSVHQNGLIQSYTILVFEQQTNTTVEEHQDFQENMIIITSLHPHYDYTLSVAAHTVTLGPYGSVTLMTSQDGRSEAEQSIVNLLCLLNVFYAYYFQLPVVHLKMCQLLSPAVDQSLCSGILPNQTCRMESFSTTLYRLWWHKHQKCCNTQQQGNHSPSSTYIPTMSTLAL